MFVIHFFYRNVSSKNLVSLCLCFFKKSVSQYLFPTNWLLLIVIDKFTLIEFASFSLFTKGAFVFFSKIYFCVKSHSFTLSLTLCCPLSFKTECKIPFDICSCHCYLFCRIDKFALLKSLIFVNVFSVLQLIFQKKKNKKKYTY